MITLNRECDEIRRLISERLDHPSTPDSERRVQAHLTGCAECAAFARVTRSGVAGLAAMTAVPGSQRVRENVMAAVYRGPDARPVGWDGWARQGLQLAGAGLAFALVAVVLMTVLGGGSGDGDERNLDGFGSDTASASPTASPTVEIANDAATSEIPSVRPNECQPGQVSIETWVDPDALMTVGKGAAPLMTLVGMMTIKETGGVVCYLDTEVTVSLLDALGQPLDIEGNEQIITLNGLVPDDALGAMFAWNNWCGEEGDVSLRVEGAGATIEQSPIPMPECRDANIPSTLGQTEKDEAFTPDSMIDSSCGSWFAVLSNDEFPDDVPAGAVALWFGEGIGVECRDGGPMVLSIRDNVGTILDIENNPLELLPQPSADQPDFSVAGVIWTNWCGETDELMFQFEQANTSSGSGGSLDRLPTCTDANEPSRLTVTDDVPENWAPNLSGVEGPAPGILGTPGGVETDCYVADIEMMLETDVDGGVRVRVLPVVEGKVYEMAISLSVVVSDADGKPLAIVNNPALIEQYGDPTVMLDTTFLWENWCDDATQPEVTANVNEIAVTMWPETLPICRNAGQPSTLEVEEP